MYTHCWNNWLTSFFIAIQTTLQSTLNMLDQLFFKNSALLKCEKQEYIQHLECYHTAEGIVFSSFFCAMSTNLMWLTDKLLPDLVKSSEFGF